MQDEAVAAIGDRGDVATAVPSHGSHGSAVASFSAAAANTVHFYLCNHRGDTVMVVGESGAVETHLQYDAFGNVTAQSGSFLPTYTFSTKEHLPGANLYAYAYRVYDPIAGRWTQRDPIDYQDSINLYQFCGNNPVGVVDMAGLSKEDIDGILDELWNSDMGKDPIARKIIEKLRAMNAEGKIVENSWLVLILGGRGAYTADGNGTGVIYLRGAAKDSYDTLVHEGCHAYQDSIGLIDLTQPHRGTEVEAEYYGFWAGTYYALPRATYEMRRNAALSRARDEMNPEKTSYPHLTDWGDYNGIGYVPRLLPYLGNPYAYR